MLSWSADSTGITWDPRGITDPSIDTKLAGGSELVAFVDAAHGTDPAVTAAARDRVAAVLGSAAVGDAAGVIGNFNQMNRLADATGMPVGPGSLRRTEELRARAGIVPFH